MVTTNYGATSLKGGGGILAKALLSSYIQNKRKKEKGAGETFICLHSFCIVVLSSYPLEKKPNLKRKM